MDIYTKIIRFFERPQDRNSGVPQQNELCALCWGYQEYDKKIRTIVKDRQIDVNNHLFKYMRIQKLLKEHIEGVKLKKGLIRERRLNNATTGGSEKSLRL